MLTRGTAAALIVLAAAALSFRNTYEPDLWWHLAHGREDAAGRLVRTNVFSFNYPDYRQHYTSWLFETVAYAAWSVGGGAAIQGMQTTLLALALGLVVLACRARAPTAAAVSVVAFGVFVLEPRALPRPYLVSFAGLALGAWLIERALTAKTAAPLVWFVPAVAAWSNFHVECVFGVALVGVFSAAELVRPAALPRREAWRACGIAAACVVATLANPYGVGLWRYLFENTAVPRILDIAELRAPYLPNYRCFFVYLVAGGLLLLSRPRMLRLWEVAVAVLFAGLGLRYLRLTPLVFLVTAPMVASRIGALMSRGLDGRAVVATALVACVVFSRVPITALATGVRAGTAAVMPSAFFSTGAVAFARGHGLEGPVFNSNNLGGFIAWTMYRDARIFQDGRLQAYPPEHFNAILNAAGSQADWDRLVAGVDWAVLSTPRPYALSGVGMFPDRDWALVFWDEAAQIVVRRAGRYAGIAARLEYELVTPDAAPLALVAQLSTDRGEQIRAEARRNRVENPDGFSAAVIMCLAGDAASCARVDRFADERPSLRDAVRLVQEVRSGSRKQGG